MLSPAAFARHFDATNLRLDATAADLERLCDEARRLGCAAVMVYPSEVEGCARRLAGSEVAVGTVIGFPSGRFSTTAKVAEIGSAAAAGAREVDIVLRYAALRDGRPAEAARDLGDAVTAARAAQLLSKVIIETCFLTPAQVVEALRVVEDSGADFIKTSTGFGTAGATVEVIRLLRAERRRPDLRIKAAGGMKCAADALAMIEAGAERLGASSYGAMIAEFASGAAGPAGSGTVAY